MKSKTKKQATTQWGSSFDGCATLATPIKGIDPCDRNSDNEHKDNPCV